MERSKIFALLLLAASPAYAAPSTNAWTIAGAGQSVTMAETSPLTFTVTNSAQSSAGLARFSLTFPPAYQVQGGSATGGWQVSSITNQNTTIEFVATNCPTGLAPGQAVSVTVNVLPAATTADVASESISVVSARNCSAKNFGGNPTSLPTWSRRGLAVSLAASPTSLVVNGEVTLNMNVTNRTTATKSGIAGSLQPFAGTATQLVAPSGTVTLATNASATLTWIYQVTSSGVYTFQGSASTTGTTSKLGVSNAFAVSGFTALITLSPINAGLGGTVTVSMLVQNNSSSTIQKVSPSALTFLGTATATPVTSPAGNVNLAAGSSTTFTWTYTMNGAVGQTYQFQGYATSQSSGNTNTDTSAQGTLGNFNVLVTPNWALSAQANRSIAFKIQNATSIAVPKVAIINNYNASWAATSPEVWANDTSGWSGNLVKTGLTDTYAFTAPAGQELGQNQEKTFTLTFNAAPTVTDTTSYTFRVQVYESKSKVNGTFDRTLAAVTRILDVQGFAISARPGTHVLWWSNTQTAGTLHDGVLVLRSSAAAGPPSTPPVDGTAYTAGQTLGNATVLYADSAGSGSQSYPFAGLVDGVIENYRVWNKDLYNVYSPGNAPTPSGLASAPPVGGNPIWTYTIGFPILAAPYLAPGRGVYSASNGQSFTANSPVTGDEIWRPATTAGAIQARVEVVPLTNPVGEFMFAGDQAGFGYAVNAATGRILWAAKGGAALCERIQAAVVVQRRGTSRTSAAFNARYPHDVVFFASRNSSNSNNALYAVRGDSGALLWTFDSSKAGGAPIDIVSGQPAIDYRRDRIYLPTFNGVYAVSTLDGSKAWYAALGTVDSSPALARETSSSDDRLYIGNQAGTLYNVNPNDGSVRYSQSGIGNPVHAVFVNGPNLIFSTSGGQLRHLKDTGSGFTSNWAGTVSVANPSGALPFYSKDWIFVGSSDGKLHRFLISDGSDNKQWGLTAAGGRISTPAMDVNNGVVAVGTLDGRLHALYALSP